MHSPAPHPPGHSRALGRSALGVVLLYACFSALWILLSDRAVEWLFEDRGAGAIIGTFKGWIFVAVTSGLLYLLLHRRQGRAEDALHTVATSRRRVWTVLAVTALALATLIGISAWQGFADEKEQARTRLQAIAETRTREVSNWHAERLREAAWTQRSVYLRERWLQWAQSERDTDALRLRQFMMSFFINDGVFKRIELVDAEGRLRLDSNVPTPASGRQAPVYVHPTLHAAVLEALTTNRAQRAGPWRDAQGELRLAFVAPVAADSPWPAAMVLHVDPPEYLHPSMRLRPPIETADIFLFRAEDEDVLILSDLRYEAGAALRKRLPRSDTRYISARTLHVESLTGQFVEGLDYRGVPSYGVARPVIGTDWWLLVKQDRSEVLFRAVVKSGWIGLAGLLALLAIGTALYLYVERQRLYQSTREVEELRRIERTLSESEAQYRLLAENSSDVVWLYDLANDRFLYASPSVENLLGYSANEMLKFSMRDVVSPDFYPVTKERISQRVQDFVNGDESARTKTLESINMHKDGHTVPVEVVSTLLADEQGQITRMLGVSRDISERKKSQAQLLQLSQAIEQSPASVIITALDGRIEYVNPAFERISGYSMAEVQGQKPALLRSGRTPVELYTELWKTLGAGQPWNGEVINRHKDGHEYTLSMNVAPVRNTQGQVTHYLAVQLDVTAQRDAEQKAFQLAWFNPLTGLPNRHRLLADMTDALQAHRRTGELYALLLLNLDRFQTVNDALGHSAGDQLLKLAGERLSTLLHADDRLAYLSGDEFAFLLHTGTGDFQTASTAALRVAQAVHEALDAPFALPERDSLTVTCSIGVTLVPMGFSGTGTANECLGRADTALHRAKAAGTRQTALFDSSMEQLIRRRFAIEQDLRRGLGASELRLFLQPQVNAQGNVISAEALVRWQHPEHGLLAPGTFIPVAEECELIIELGRWVLDEVCRHLGALRGEGLHLPLSVNVSPRQFHQPGFVHVVQDIMQKHGAAPQDLVIEITESIVMDQMDSVVQKMAQLNRLGVRFSLDDFGTGYSSLAYLKRLPIHELKIDRSFVQDAPNNPNDAALVEAILSVAQHLRLKVVAEGVETREQADFLNARGQVLQQGYLHGRPEPAEALLARWRASHGVVQDA